MGRGCPYTETVVEKGITHPEKIPFSIHKMLLMKIEGGLYWFSATKRLKVTFFTPKDLHFRSFHARGDSDVAVRPVIRRASRRSLVRSQGSGVPRSSKTRSTCGDPTQRGLLGQRGLQPRHQTKRWSQETTENISTKVKKV